MKNKLYQLVGMIMIGSIALFSCEKEKKDSAPQLPPLTAFVIDSHEFNQAKSTKSYNNFGAAVMAIGYWNSALYSTLVVPVASYVEALNHEAERVNNTTWKWSYDVEALDASYSAELFAEVIADSVYLEMHISKESGFQDFVWYTGKFDIVRTAGEWTVYNNPESNLPWLEIEWDHNWKAETFDISYTNVLEGNDYIDSYIEWGITDDPTCNAYFEIYDSLNDKDYLIEVNTTTHNGRITYDGTPHCWDNDLQDIDCTF